MRNPYNNRTSLITKRYHIELYYRDTDLTGRIAILKHIEHLFKIESHYVHNHLIIMWYKKDEFEYEYDEQITHCLN